MRDFSRDGLYFLTEQSCYSTGMQLYAIPAFGSLNLEYLAEVVRVERTWGGEYGVALRLLRASVKDAAQRPRPKRLPRSRLLASSRRAARPFDHAEIVPGLTRAGTAEANSFRGEKPKDATR